MSMYPHHRLTKAWTDDNGVPALLERRKTMLQEEWPQLYNALTVAVIKPHTTFLVTGDDYKHAPHGTVVAADKCPAFTKTSTGQWMSATGHPVPPDAMANTYRRVLRRGWDE